MSAVRKAPTTTTPEAFAAEVDGHGMGEDEVVLQEQASGVEAFDRQLMTGLLVLVRLAGGGTGALTTPRSVSDHVQPVGQDMAALQPSATAEIPAIPRWPANRTMRLDQPGR